MAESVVASPCPQVDGQVTRVHRKPGNRRHIVLNILVAVVVFTVTIAAAFICANPPVDGDGVFRWQTEGDAFQQELTYRNRTLVIQKEGIYFIYSKIYYNESPCGLFKHEVVRQTTQFPTLKTLLSPRYNDPMTLMQNIRYRCLNTQRSDRTDRKETGNSFLSGAFELKTGDLIYVKVNNKSLVLSGMHDNFFGAFMI
ncbi:tumor necrosis factor ligand superfamily member 10-like [Chanos chanos]|uniref:Tumor necrosis factor ligand superfamily member 10-like n=1 Tax=Chanos chanos TaxID=29144 RepID=A0A6J2VSZ5_CHACN|nr:tumor necrosis factor ligand superfamily member 10-like [Chanos chanos]